MTNRTFSLSLSLSLSALLLSVCMYVCMYAMYMWMCNNRKIMTAFCFWLAAAATVFCDIGARWGPRWCRDPWMHCPALGVRSDSDRTGNFCPNTPPSSLHTTRLPHDGANVTKSDCFFTQWNCNHGTTKLYLCFNAGPHTSQPLIGAESSTLRPPLESRCSTLKPLTRWFSGAEAISMSSSQVRTTSLLGRSTTVRL